MLGSSQRPLPGEGETLSFVDISYCPHPAFLSQFENTRIRVCSLAFAPVVVKLSSKRSGGAGRGSLPQPSSSASDTVRRSSGEILIPASSNRRRSSSRSRAASPRWCSPSKTSKAPVIPSPARQARRRPLRSSSAPDERAPGRAHYDLGLALADCGRLALHLSHTIDAWGAPPAPTRPPRRPGFPDERTTALAGGRRTFRATTIARTCT